MAFPNRLAATAVLLTFGLVVMPPSALGVTLNLNDVPPGDADHGAIAFLNRHDVLYGYPDGTFHPDANVTRGEILKIVLEANGDGQAALTAPVGETGIYTDVPTSHTLAPYIAFAAGHSYISGYEDGTFRPDAQVTRAEAAKIVANILHAPAGATSDYTDMDGSTLAPYVSRLAVANWFRPAPPLYNPNIPATRREIARMTYRALVSTAASPARTYSDGMTEPDSLGSDWSVHRDGAAPYDLPPGWQTATGQGTENGATIDLVAVAPWTVSAETDDEPAFALGRMELDDLDRLDAGASDGVTYLPVRREIAVGSNAMLVGVLEIIQPGTVHVAWLTPKALYVAMYFPEKAPGLRGLFDRFVQHAIEATVSTDGGVVSIPQQAP